MCPPSPAGSPACFSLVQRPAIPHEDANPGRRRLLRMVTAAAGVAVGSGLVSSLARAAAVVDPADGEAALRTHGRPRDDHGRSSPDEILAALMAGNARFVEGRVQAPHRNMARLKEVAHQQAPQAAFLGCSDSRVPIEIVFDQGFGDLFVVRDAGNVISPEVIASLEFGTLVLGARLLFVLGHSGCGAVSATLKGEAVPGQISALYARIQPAVDSPGGNLGDAIANNVRLQAQLLRRSSPVIKELVARGALRIVGGVYDLDSGRVRLLEATGSSS